MTDIIKLKTALSILGWSQERFDTLIEDGSLRDKIFKEMEEKLIKIPKGEGVETNYAEQWAYGVLLNEAKEVHQDL